MRVADGQSFKNTNVERKKRVSFMEPCDQSNADKQYSVDNQNNADKQINVNDSMEQNAYNDEKYGNIRIEFSPSSYVPNIPESNNAEIQSPADIYKMFNEPIKSILKRSPNDMMPNQMVPLYKDSSSDTENESYSTKVSAYMSVMKDIREKKTATFLNNIVEKKNGKRVSRFKMERVGSAK